LFVECVFDFVCENCKVDNISAGPYGQYIVEIYVSWLSDNIVRFKIEVGVEKNTLKSHY